MNSIGEYINYVDFEKNLFLQQLEKIYDKDIDIVISRKSIGDIATVEFGEQEMFASGRVDQSTMKMLLQSLGGTVQTTLWDLASEDRFYGHCKSYRRVVLDQTRYELFEEPSNNSFATVLLSGSNSVFLQEAVIGLKDAITTIQNIHKSQGLMVRGGGSFEIHIAHILRQFQQQQTMDDKQLMVIESFKAGLKSIVQTLLNNSSSLLNQGVGGFKNQDSILIDRLFDFVQPPTPHQSSAPSSFPPSLGIDKSGNLCDMDDQNILEPLNSKLSYLNDSLDLVCLLLSVY